MALGVFQDGVFQANVFQIGTAMTSTAGVLPLPVDCVMAGDADAPPDGQRTQLSFKTGRPQGRALRHIYGE